MSEKRIDAFKRINAPRIDKVLTTFAMIAKSGNGVKLDSKSIDKLEKQLNKSVKQLIDGLKGDTALSIGFSFDD